MRKKNLIVKSLGLGLLSVWFVVVMATVVIGSDASNSASKTELPTERLSLDNDNE